MRAFFNIRLDGAVLPDRVGQEVPDPQGIRVAARAVVRGLAQRHGDEPRLLDAALLVTDEAGATLLDISFFEALYLPVEPVADPERRRVAVRPARSASMLSAALRPVRRVAEALAARG